MDINEYTNLTPEDYIKQQPGERQAAIKALRNAILNNLPPGFKEIIQYGMIGYVVPHEINDFLQ